MNLSHYPYENVFGESSQNWDTGLYGSVPFLQINSLYPENSRQFKTERRTEEGRDVRKKILKVKIEYWIDGEGRRVVLELGYFDREGTMGTCRPEGS